MEFAENIVINFSKELKFREALDNNVKNFPKIVLTIKRVFNKISVSNWKENKKRKEKRKCY